MKIFEVIPSLGTGGAEKFVVDLSNQFFSEGHEVILVTLYDLNQDSKLNQYLNCNIRRFSLNKKKGVNLIIFWKLWRLIVGNKPDVVHVHVGAIKYLLLSVFLYCKCGYYATIHSEAKREAGKGFEKLIRFIFFKIRLVCPITISEESQKSFRGLYNCSSVLIKNGACQYKKKKDIKTEYRYNTDFLFVHVGRIIRVKNQILIVKAVSKLLNEGYKIKLLLLGRIEEEDVFNDLSSYFSERIIYVGESDNPRDYMNIADAFCLSSLMEGMPITIIEALSVGCIPIVTPVGGCVNMIKNGFNGFISEDLSLESYADCLKKIINMPYNKRVEMKKNAINSFVSNYSIAQASKNYLELFSCDYNDKVHK